MPSCCLIQKLQEKLTQLKEEIKQLQDLIKQLQEENFQLREVEVQDTKRMEEKLQNLLESYGERSRYAHSWSK